MELRTPARLSDDEIYHFAETAPTAPPSQPPSIGQPVASDVLSTPTPAESTPRTMISDPVIVTLAGPTPAGSDSVPAPAGELAGTESAGTNGKSNRSDGTQTQPVPPTAAAKEGGATAGASIGPQISKLRAKRRKRVRLRYLMQAWGVSLVVHVVILSALAAATFTSPDTVKKIINFDSALASYSNGEPEVLPIYADPDNVPRKMRLAMSTRPLRVRWHLLRSLTGVATRIVKKVEE